MLCSELAFTRVCGVIGLHAGGLSFLSGFAFEQGATPGPALPASHFLASPVLQQGRAPWKRPAEGSTHPATLGPRVLFPGGPAGVRRHRDTGKSGPLIAGTDTFPLELGKSLTLALRIRPWNGKP